jgi:hypothetical protein
MRIVVLCLVALCASCLAEDDPGEGSSTPAFLGVNSEKFVDDGVPGEGGDLVVYREVFHSGAYRDGFVSVDYTESFGLGLRPLLGWSNFFGYGQDADLIPIPNLGANVFEKLPGDSRQWRWLDAGYGTDVGVMFGGAYLRATNFRYTNGPDFTRLMCTSERASATCLAWEVAIAQGYIDCYNAAGVALPSDRCVGFFPRLHWGLHDVLSPLLYFTEDGESQAPLDH